MKIYSKFYHLGLISFLLLVIGFGEMSFAQKSNQMTCDSSNSASANEKFGKVQAKMNELVSLGIPGIVAGVKTPQETWYSAAGLSKIETKTPMNVCNLQYLQSISKTYLAVSILQLYEQGKLDLDAPVTTYLPAELASWITQSDQITVRMLLNHTSGIPEYNYLPEYITVLLQNPDYPFEPIDYMELIKGKELDFESGSRYSYRNSGFVLLALMMDHLTGDHAKFIRENILQKLDLENTFYRNNPNYLDNPALVDGYWDRYSNGIVENSSYLQVQNVKKMVGDDGIVTTASDGIRFLEGLMNGELIKKETLAEMTTWVNDSKAIPQYGLGLDLTTLGGKEAIGHSGGGLGAGSQLYYFPEQQTYIFLAINLATVTGSPIHTKAEKVLNELYLEVLEIRKKR
jgi:D-alanyl-D-alanine carboxypeptidase